MPRLLLIGCWQHVCNSLLCTNYLIASGCLQSSSTATSTRPDGKSWIKLSKQKGKKGERKMRVQGECVLSFLQSETRTSGCFVKMISQRSVKVKHKAEVKDKHNSCVLSASGDEPNLTSRTAAWQPEINAYALLPLQ